ncbi:hypothetical protein D3C75_537410 [compost metagenome]
MPFEHSDFTQTLYSIYIQLPCHYRYRNYTFNGLYMIFSYFNNSCSKFTCFNWSRDNKIFGGRTLRQMNRSQNFLWICEFSKLCRHHTVFGNYYTRGNRKYHVNIGQIPVQQNNIRKRTWSNRSDILRQPKTLCCINSCHLEGCYWFHALSNRMANNEIHMTFVA